MGKQEPGTGPTVVQIRYASEIAGALATAAVPRDRPVLVVVGGAGGMTKQYLRLFDHVLRDALLPVIAACAAVVVDGGTDSGVMRGIGLARHATRGVFPLIGVAAEGTVVVPDGDPPAVDAADLEARHTHVLLVPGTSWGDESRWLAEVAGVIAGTRPSVTVLLNGGEIAYADVSHSLDARRPVVVLAGSGRTADAIADAAATGHAVDPRAARIAASDLTSVVPIDDVPTIRAMVAAALSQ